MRAASVTAILLLGLAGQAAARESGPPKWAAGTLPEGRFLGTASALATEDLARQAATSSALLEIAHSLGVRVEGELLEQSVLQVKQGREDSSESIDRRIRAVSKVLVRVRTDRYESQKDCGRDGACHWSAWVLVAFSKQDHLDYMDGLAEEACSEIAGASERSARLADGGNFDGASRALAEATNAGSVLDGIDGVPTEVSARLRECREQLRNAAESLLAELKIVPDVERIEGLRRELMAQPLGFKAERSKGVPAAGLTIGLRSVEGDVQFVGTPRTGDDGRVLATILSFKGHAPRYVVEARPGSPLVATLGVITPVSRRVEILARPGTMALSITPAGTGADAAGVWTNALATVLERRGFQIARGKSHPDYVLNVEIRVRDDPAGSLHRAILEASVRLADATGQTLWSWQFPDSRFRSLPVSAPSFEDARNQATRGAVTTLLMEWIAASIEQHT